MEKDKRLLGKVQDLLAREPDLQPFLNYVYLNVVNGTVTIRGWVPNIFIKNRIIELITGISCVKLSSENLEVDQFHHRVGVAFDWIKGRMAIS